MLRWVMLIAPLVLFVLGTGSVSAVSGCLDTPLAGLAQSRWQVIQPCVTVNGVVEIEYADPNEQDGNYWMVLRLDPAYRDLLPDNARSAGLVWVKYYKRVLEAYPKEGAHVAVTGALVDDLVWGWREIVPAWGVLLLDRQQVTQRPPIVLTMSQVPLAGQVQYNIVIGNTTGQPMANVYIAGSLPDGIIEWVFTVPTDGMVLSYLALAHQGRAFAHWLAPYDGTAQAEALLVR